MRGMAMVVAAVLMASACGAEESGPLEPLRGPGIESEDSAVGGSAAESGDSERIVVTVDRPPIDGEIPRREPTPVILTDQGAQPHRVLRLEPEIGHQSRVEITHTYEELAMIRYDDGRQNPVVLESGPAIFEIAYSAVDHQGDQLVHDAWLLERHVTIGDGYGGFSTLREDARLASQTDGLRVVRSTRGEALGHAFLPGRAPGNEEETERVLGETFVVLAYLPEEPVGVGATWTVQATAPMHRWIYEHSADLELIELDDDRAVISIRQISTSEPGDHQEIGTFSTHERDMALRGTITYYFDMPVPLIDLHSTRRRFDHMAGTTTQSHVGGTVENFMNDEITTVRLD